MICTICRNSIKSKRALKCDHIFCKTCINKWLKNNNNCPNCRTNINKGNTYNLRSRTSLNLDNVNLEVQDNPNYDERETRNTSKHFRQTIVTNELKVHLKNLAIANEASDSSSDIAYKIAIIDNIIAILKNNRWIMEDNPRVQTVLQDRFNNMKQSHNKNIYNKAKIWDYELFTR